MVEAGVDEQKADDALNIVEILGENLPDDMTLRELIEACVENGSIDRTIMYLQRECPLCFAVVPESRVSS